MTGLSTDLYEIRMAVSYLRHGMTAPATFSLFVRRLPPGRGFLVCAGLADCLDFLEQFHFTDAELAYLRDQVGLDSASVRALGELRFTGDVMAVPEGRVVFAGEPLLEVTAPIAQAQLAETALLNFTTFQTAVASKAARCRIAAAGADLIDFAARRTHGLEAALAVARSSAIAGFLATSYAAAASRYGLLAAGTMAHSYIQAFPDERSAFRAFADDFPESAVLLVDTYDSQAGVHTAIQTAREVTTARPTGVRLDSGDLFALASSARRLLDQAGLCSARIVASGGLDEHAIASLVARGAPIDTYGVGTRMGVSADAPSLDSAYKLVEYDHRPVMKLSPGKVSAPCAKQVYRGRTADADILDLRAGTPPPDREPLLIPVMRDGRRVGPYRTAQEAVLDARDRFEADLAWLPARARQLCKAHPVPVHHSDRLAALTARLSQSLTPGHPRSPVPEL